MAIGKSGGRSASNKQSSVRRATPREREGIDPPGRDAWEKVYLDDERRRFAPKVEARLNMIAWGLWTFVCVFLAILVCAWVGLV